MASSVNKEISQLRRRNITSEAREIPSSMLDHDEPPTPKRRRIVTMFANVSVYDVVTQTTPEENKDSGKTPHKLMSTSSREREDHIQIPVTDLTSNVSSCEDETESRQRWDDNSVEIRGLKGAVESTLQNIETYIELKTMEIPIDEDEFRTLTLCGVLGDVKQNFRHVYFEFSDDRNVLTVISPDAYLLTIQKAILENTIKERKIEVLTESVREHLIKTAAVNRTKIQDGILAQGIKAQFISGDDELFMKSRSEDDHDKAVEVIKTMTWEANFDVPGHIECGTEVVGNFLEEIAKQNCAIYEKDSKSVDIVGFTDADSDAIRSKFKTLLENHMVRNATVRLTIYQAKFVMDYCKNFNADSPKRKALEGIRRPPKPGGILCLEGTQNSIQEAQSEIKQIVAGMVVEKHSRSGAGIKNYYLDPSHKGVIESIRCLNNCYIVAIPRKPTNVKKPTKDANASNAATNVPKMGLFTTQLGKLTLTICKADIITHMVDAIVNIIIHSNNLTLTAGVSRALKAYDIRNGNRIAEEMADLIRTGNLPLPVAFMTGSGNLPTCKKIIHSVAAEWSKASQMEHNKLVSSCIEKILTVAEQAKLTSIAIPAIGCGVSGINPSDGIPWIVDTVRQYFQRHPTSCIIRVDFVEFKNQKVVDEFKKALEQMELRSAFPESSPLDNASTMTAPTAVLQLGNIAERKVDAVVNIMAKKHIADMTKGSAIAKVLAAAAGQDVVKECAGNSGKYNEGDIFVTSAGSLPCKNIIHGIVSKHDSKSADIVKKIMEQSLQHADQANYR